ncbi:GrpE protein [Flavihumibacter petaseus NBRC 106054]|uniref:Protein GrpE n=2 Tax=Flavihumibacter TaxID=1004301 RepID=A0A0E9MU63_9BACT|nr:GrpE protein [Flavihumibacter petaseus NBRC 106054]
MAKIARFAANLYDMEDKDRENQVDMDINADSDVPGTSHLQQPIGDAADLEKMEQELADSKDKYLRLVAEFDNFRKRTARERLELVQTAGKDVITSLLDVLDDAERAEKQLAGIDESQGEGVKLVFNKLRNVLQARGLKAMESIGTDFDPDKHEAITEIPAPQPSLAGKVVDEVVKGYYLNDKIIRFAKVVVGK